MDSQTTHTPDELNALLGGPSWHRPTPEEMRAGAYVSWYPDFFTSPEMAIRLLDHETQCSWSVDRNENTFCVTINIPWKAPVQPGSGRTYQGFAETFARAACIALLKNKGVFIDCPDRPN